MHLSSFHFYHAYFGADGQVKEAKEKAMNALSPYRQTVSQNQKVDGAADFPQASANLTQSFVSLLEFLSEIYQVPLLFFFLASQILVT